jgi:manganese/iron transport system substrate-binding protein
VNISIPNLRKALLLLCVASFLGACANKQNNLATSSNPTESSSPGATASPNPGGGNLPKVVTTNSVLCDLTKQIAADTIDLKCLVQAGTDPHVYKITPEDRQAIEDAKLVLYGGYDFEHNLVKTIQASKSTTTTKVPVFELAVPQPQTFEEQGKSTKDPHVFHNPKHGVKILEVIQTNLSKIFPDRGSVYGNNAKKIATELHRIDTWITTQMNTIPEVSKTLITTHDALGYYAKAYNLTVATIEGVSTEEKPTAAKVKEVVETIKKSKVPTIFAELSVNPKLIENVAKEAGVKVAAQEIFADGLGGEDSEASTYQKMLISNTKTIVTGLGGRYSPISN